MALGGWLTAELADGSADAYARGVWFAGLSAWGWGELTDGANSFRRVLGAGGLIYVVVSLGAALASRG